MPHRLAPAADSDLDEIWVYVAKHSGSMDRADSLIRHITDQIQLLAQNPFIGRRRDDLRPGLRSFPVGHYVILYRVEGEAVVILHVFHGSRDPQLFLGS